MMSILDLARRWPLPKYSFPLGHLPPVNCVTKQTPSPDFFDWTLPGPIWGEEEGGGAEVDFSAVVMPQNSPFLRAYFFLWRTVVA